MGDGEWKTVRVVGTEEEAALISGYLESEGLTVVVQSLLFKQEPVNFGRLGDVRIRVRADQAAEAERLLAAADAAPLEPSDITEEE